MGVKKESNNRADEDWQMIQRAVNGNDQQAYASLLDRYRKSVYFMVLKMVRDVDDAEDLTMEAFQKAFKNLAKFKNDYNFSTWLFRIATNNAIDFMRKKKLKTKSLDTSYTDDSGETVQMDIEDKNLNPQEEAIMKEKVEFTRYFVTKLPGKYQKLVKLRYFKGMKYHEISQELDTPLGTVKAQLHRARELMLDIMKDKKDHI